MMIALIIERRAEEEIKRNKERINALRDYISKQEDVALLKGSMMVSLVEGCDIKPQMYPRKSLWKMVRNSDMVMFIGKATRVRRHNSLRKNAIIQAKNYRKERVIINI